MTGTVSPLTQSVVARAAAASAQLFTAGQVLEAVVLGRAPDGLTAIRIGDVVVNAQLPQPLPTGTALQLRVVSGGTPPQLAIVLQPQMPAAPQMPAPVPLPIDLPAVLPSATTAPEPMVGAGPPAASGAVPGSQPQAGQPTPAIVPPALSNVATPAAAPVPIPPAGPIVTAAPPPTVAAMVPTPGQAPSQNGESVQRIIAVAAPSTSGGATPGPGAMAPPLAALVAATDRPMAGSAGTQAAWIASGAAQTAPAAGPAARTVAAPTTAPLPNVAAAALPAAVLAATPAPVPPPVAERMATTPPASVPANAPVSASVVEPASTPAPAIAAAPTPTAPRPNAPLSNPLPIAANAASVPAPPAPAIAEPNPLLLAQGATRPAATMADLVRVAPQAAAAPVGHASLQPARPQAALTQMVPEALARQNSMVPLLVSLAGAVGRVAALPEPVMRAAMQVLAQRVSLPSGGPTAATLEAAIVKSGLYLEAGLAKGVAQPDMKSGLAALKGALASWLGSNPAPVHAAQQVAPPLRGMPPRAELPDQPPLPDIPLEAGRLLHSQADAALSRVKLMQFASLPDADPARGGAPELRMEVPFLIGSELAVAQFQIFRDGARRKDERKRGWTMRFAMNFSGTGEVGAEVGLLGRVVNVALWAAEHDTAERLSAALPELAPALASLGLEAGSIRLSNLPQEPEKPASGHFVDSLS